MDECTLINDFVRYLESMLHVGLAVERWPDKENRATPDIDAVAAGNGIRLAIELTSVDSFPHERKDDPEFVKLSDSVSKKVAGKFSGTVSVTLPVGVKYKGVDSVLAGWLIDNVPSLPYGWSKHRIDGLSFDITVLKDNTDENGFYMARVATQETELPTGTYQLLNSKLDKLGRYKESGHKTLLLIESEDIAQMSFGRIRMEVFTWLESTESVHPDEAWFAKTAIPTSITYRRIVPPSTSE